MKEGQAEKPLRGSASRRILGLEGKGFQEEGPQERVNVCVDGGLGWAQPKADV